MEKTDIRSMEYDVLKDWVKAEGQSSYRADQLFSWMHEKLVSSFADMSNLPRSFRDHLEDTCTLSAMDIRKVQISKEDGTRKYLFALEDGNLIESVLMKYRHGNTVCVSSQVGCAMGCSFCASTLNGCVRNLNTSEILGQVYEIQKDTKARVSNVVIMGMGEPMMNYDNVMSFIRILSDEKALHVSQRNITISTCGIVPAIKKLSLESLKVTLAISLHAPNDDIRRRIMPVAKRYSINEILTACDEYFENTGRRVTFEYCLIDGINDRPEHARELAVRIRGRNAHVNLIPVNPVRENNYGAAAEENINRFKGILEGEGIQVTRRREMGRDIDGACGQLKAREINV